ncbi:MAG TPA: sodium-dependent transporter [Ohtaekwangia sp.]|nr:sodium-dependent transporter [Ohtaekwangia sp.]
MTNRGNFSGRIGFILAAAGSAVGLGNIWRFPYLAGQNGGAVFLFLYLACIFLLCYPVMVGEIAIGRAANSDAYGSYKKFGGRRWGILGILGIIAGILILSFYNVVAGWAFGYFLNISFGSLLQEQDYGSFFGVFVNDILDLTSWKGISYSNLLFSLAFMAITAYIVSQGIQKGIEAANKIMMPSLYFILLGLIIYSLTLPNAFSGVEFYLVPDFSEIKLQTIFDALRQAFFSLSLGMGALITYGSYLSKKENIVSSAAVISIADTSVAFFAGLMVFPLVFSQNMSPTEGPALVFMVLPQVFQEMGPILGRIVGGGFFLLLCFAALTSTVSLLEVPVAYLVDQKKFPRKAVVWVLAGIIFIVGLPSMVSQGVIEFLNKLPFYQGRDFLTFVSDMSDILLTVGGCLMCIFIRYRWKLYNLNEELSYGNNPSYAGSFLQKYINFTISYVCPLLLGVLSILVIIDKFFGLDKIFG